MQKPKIGNFSFSILQWNFDPVERNYRFFGSYYRGILGTTLKRKFCILRNVECETCPLKDKCLYMLTFERYKDALFPPYVINRARRDFLRMVFVGSFAEFSEAFLGILSRRLNAKEKNYVMPLFGPVEGKKVIRSVDLALLKSPSQQLSISLRFLRLKKDSRLIECEKLTFDDILRAIERRVYLVNKFYGDSISEVVVPEFEGTWTLTECSYFRVKRYSNRKKRLMEIPTAHCLFHIRGNVDSIFPFLVAGEYLNVGTNASMGFGELSFKPL